MRYSDIDIQVWDLIKRDCSEFLSINKNRFLYRGLRNVNQPYLLDQSPRRIFDGDHIDLEYSYDIYLKSHGYVPRSNAAFATSDYEIATQYGEIYVLFPLNGFASTTSDCGDLPLCTTDWLRYQAQYDVEESDFSQEIKDELIDKISDTSGDLYIFNIYVNEDDNLKKILFTYMDTIKFTNDINVALDTGKEVWIEGNCHYIRYDVFTKLSEGVGRIVKGVNTTADVGVGEITKQAKKFGFNVSKDGVPPLIHQWKPKKK